MSRRTFSIVPIVEGHGEVEAVPILLRRLGGQFAPDVALRVLRPIRRSRDRIVRPGELEKDVQLAAEMLEGAGAILILLDSDGDCPAQLGPSVLKRAEAARPDRTIRVVLAHQEYEAWLLAAANSIRGKRHLKSDLTAPDDPEAVRGAKEWLKRSMQGPRTYSETVDQPALTAIFDLGQARSSPSFDRFCRVFEELLQEAPTS
jgi:hypothetical protein